MPTMTYAVSDFVADLGRLSAAHTDDKALLPEIAPLVKKLATSPGWVKPDFYDLDDETGIGITVVHEEEDHTLLVETVAWGSGQGVLPHDHQTWGVVAGIDGNERNVLWKRTDDGSEPGHAKVEVHRETRVGAGDVIGFLGDDIHSVNNDGEATSLSLHVYGKSLSHVDRNEFVPDENVVRPCPKRPKKAL
jgi:predicted metal-dependent enzyme (double-stranded beta helix superfamily)